MRPSPTFQAVEEWRQDIAPPHPFNSIGRKENVFLRFARNCVFLVSVLTEISNKALNFAFGVFYFFLLLKKTKRILAVLRSAKTCRKNFELQSAPPPLFYAEIIKWQ
jgi:hypothetical protein